MKKKLALFLATVMAIATASLIMIPTVSAEVVYDQIEGIWTTMGDPRQYSEDYYGDKSSVPGYKYTEDGFSMTGADWSTSKPFATLQSSSKIYLKSGVYMEIRIDEFSYDAPNKWFNIHIWDSPNIVPQYTDNTFGEGVQTIILASSTGPTAAPDPVGACSSIMWYKEAFTNVINSSIPIDTENRATVMDGNGASYEVQINGTQAPQSLLEYMNTKFADGYAYLGFTMSNSKRGGMAAATITKFGTSKSTATTPYGTDYKEAENFDNSTAPIADPSTVITGFPAVFMTGDIKNSDLMDIPYSIVGSDIELTGNGTVKVTATGSTADFGVWRVDREKSYDIKDFPVVMCMTKNLCNCRMDSHLDCLALECIDAYVLAGDELEPQPRSTKDEMDMSYDPYIINDDNYLYFYKDMSESSLSGRFNGALFTVSNCDLTTPGFDQFEMLWVGLFRNTEEAKAFALKYLEIVESGILPDDFGDITTDTETETETETVPPIGTSDTERTMSQGNIYADILASVSINDTYYGKVFRFVPQKSGSYTFVSVGRYDTIGYVLDGSGNTLASDYGGNGNFGITLWMTAGKTYYLCTEMYDLSSYGMYNVYVTLGENETDETYIETTTDGFETTDREDFTGFDSDELASIIESKLEDESRDETEGEDNGGGSLMALDGCFISAGFGGAVIALVSVISAAACIRRKKD